MQKLDYHSTTENKFRRVLTTYNVDGTIVQTNIADDAYLMSYDRLSVLIHEAEGVEDPHLWKLMEYCAKQLKERQEIRCIKQKRVNTIKEKETTPIWKFWQKEAIST